MKSNNEEKDLEKLRQEISEEKKEIEALEGAVKKEKEELKDLEHKLEEREHEAQEHKEIILIVNGMPKPWKKKNINLQEVITLAYGEYHPDWTNTVAYEDGPEENREGSLKLGQEICVKNKMIFHATATFNS